MVTWGYIVKRIEIPKILSDENLQETNFNQVYNIWKKHKEGYGFPYSGGWAEQPAFVMDAIDMFNQEYNKRASKG